MNQQYKLWHDDEHSNRQFISTMDEKQRFNILVYERWKNSRTRTYGEIEVNVLSWDKWTKVDPSNQPMPKAWFIRDLSVEDIILQNYEAERD